jgi:hypothetical protein
MNTHTELLIPILQRKIDQTADPVTREELLSEMQRIYKQEAEEENGSPMKLDGISA